MNAASRAAQHAYMQGSSSECYVLCKSNLHYTKA